MSLSQKQNYLYQEIIEANFDPEQFQTFLQNKRPGHNALDLNNWDFELLKKVVRQFKDKIQETQRADNKKKLHVLPPLVELQENDEIKKHCKPANLESFSRYVSCERSELSILFNLNVHVTISKYDIVDGSLFEQAYVNYTVETKQQNWSVLRRYNDFVWLRETLEKMHPGLPIPPIPKKSSFRNFQEKHLRKRMFLLESFINKLLAVPELKGEIVVMKFLHLTEATEFSKFKKESTIQQDKLQPEKLKKLKGRVHLVIEPKIEKMLSLSKENLASVGTKLNKIAKESKIVFRLMEGSSNYLQSISKIFEELSQQCELFNKKSQLEVKSSLSYLYSIMKSFTKSLSSIISEQADMIKNQLYYAYKYETMHVQALQQAIQQTQNAKQEYINFKDRLKKTKQKLIEDKTFSKWGMSPEVTQRLVRNPDILPEKQELMDMMLPKETNTEIHLKENYALINFQTYQQISRFLNQNPKYLSGKLLEIIKKQNPVPNQSIMLWADTMVNLMSFQQGKRLEQIQMK